MGNLGFPEIILILVIALIVFGPKKLPELSRTIGKALAEFRRASSDLRGAMENEMRELERHTRELEQKSQQVLASASDALPVYDPDMDSRSIGAPADSSSKEPGATAEPSPSESSPTEVKPADGHAKSA